MGKTIFQYQGDHLVADQYRAAAREFEERIEVLRELTAIPHGEVANA